MKQLSRHGEVIRLAVWVLAVLTVVTTPAALTQAKYAASGTATASARVAKWDIKFTQEPATGATGYFSGAVVSPTHPNAVNGGFPAQTATRTFKIKNDSEVTADVTVRLYYVQNDSVNFVVDASTGAVISSDANYPAMLDTLGAATSGLNSTITASGAGVVLQSGATYRFNPGAEGTFTISVKATAAAPAVDSGSAANAGNCIRKYKVFFDAVQVD